LFYLNKNSFASLSEILKSKYKAISIFLLKNCANYLQKSKLFVIMYLMNKENKMDETKGVIYILTNPSFEEYVKIGYADNLNNRLNQLNRSECTPFAFRTYAIYEVSNRLSDIKIHEIIDKLNPNLRAIDNFEGKKRVREFYAMTKEDAYNLLKSIAEINGTPERVQLITPNKEQMKDEKEAEQINKYLRTRKKLTFSEYKIPIGAKLIYVKDKDIFCKVISEKKVEYKGKQYSLSALAGKLNIERGSKNKNVAGTDVFSYNGEILSTEIRKRLGI